MNPYLNRLMIRNRENFYGRRREIMHLYSRIGAPRPQSVSIVGDRRIGKSSLLYFINHEANRSEYLPNPEEYLFLFVDFQEKGDMKVQDFFQMLSNQCTKALGERIHSDADYDYDSFTQLIKDLEHQQMKTIMLFDEFEVVTKNPNFDMTFFAFLRSLANRYNVAYVTSSGRNLQGLCHTKEIADSPFFNIFTPLPLMPFSRPEALELIEKPSAACSFPLIDYADFILDIAGAFPLHLQIACCALVEYLQSGSKPDEGGFLEVRESFLVEAMPHFQYIWSEQFDEKERNVLQKLLRGEKLDRAEMYTRRQLERRGYIVEHDGKYVPFSPLFSDIIQQEMFATAQVSMAQPAEGVTVEETERLRAELQDARQMQWSLLPKESPTLEGYQIAGVCSPASEVGGDFFDYISTGENHLCIALADVSGKGLKGAMAAAMASGVLHSEATGGRSVAEMMMHINQNLCSTLQKSMFVALTLAHLDTRANLLRFANAGGLDPLKKSGDVITPLKAEGTRLPLGMLNNIYYQEGQIELSPLDFVIFLSDGVIEALNRAEEMYGEEPLEQLIKEFPASSSAQELMDSILRDVTQFTAGAEQADDITVIVIKRCIT